MMIEPWLIMSLITTFICGLSGITSKYALKNVPSSVLVTSSFIIITPISLFLLIYYIAVRGLVGVELLYVILGLIAAVLANLGFFIYFDALEKGSATIVGSLTSAYPVIVIVGAIILLGELLSAIQAFGVSMIILGVVSLVYLHGTSTDSKNIPRAALVTSILTLFCWGFWGITLKFVLTGLDIILYLGLSTLVMPPLTLAFLRTKTGRWGFEMPKKWSVPFIMAIISVEIEQLGYYFETTSVSLGPASLVFPIIASYPIVVVLLAYAFLKERISLKEALLIAVVIAGLIVISVV